jgi:hypothetical protein
LGTKGLDAKGFSFHHLEDDALDVMKLVFLIQEWFKTPLSQRRLYQEPWSLLLYNSNETLSQEVDNDKM